MEIRSRPLDMMRAVAILLVLGNHLNPYPQANSFLGTLMIFWHRGGWTGVDLFFVLSGFLISGLLFKEYERFGSISFKHFFIRRGFKIYPAFYVMIMTTILFSVIGGLQVNFKALMSELFFLQDYIKGIWTHTWSLGVEEQFYIFLPLLLILLPRIQKTTHRPFRLIPVIFIFIAITCLGLRILTYKTLPYTYLTHFSPLHLRLDSLFFGVLISYFYHYHPFQFRALVRRSKYLLLSLGGALYIPAFIFPYGSTFFITAVGLTFLYLGSGLILIAVVEKNFKTNLFTKTASYIGRHSYPIYLWHLSINKVGLLFLKHASPSDFNWFVYAAVYLIGSILFGIFMSKILEYPVLKLRDRLYPSRSEVPPTGVGGFS